MRRVEIKFHERADNQLEFVVLRAFVFPRPHECGPYAPADLRSVILSTSTVTPVTLPPICDRQGSSPSVGAQEL